jgi:hypothetical protein
MKSSLALGFLLVGIGLAAHQADAGIIYADPLNGADATLTGTAPSDRTGGVGTNVWTANANGLFQADGDVLPSANAGAFLPFTPSAGFIYTLSADVNTTAGELNWISLGFADLNGDNAFNDASVNSYGTMLVRANRGAGLGKAFSGVGVGGEVTFTTTTGAQQLQVVLDASDANAANWTMQFYYNGSAVSNALTATSGSYANISYVGFTKIATAEGTVKDFELTAVPEPSAALMLSLGLAGLGVLRGRRRIGLRIGEQIARHRTGR